MTRFHQRLHRDLKDPEFAEAFNKGPIDDQEVTTWWFEQSVWKSVAFDIGVFIGIRPTWLMRRLGYRGGLN